MKADNLGSMRTNPLIASAAVAVMILSVIAVAAMTGVMPNVPWHKQGIPPAEAAAVNAQRFDCPLCGTVESIRTVEVRDEAGGGSASGLTGAATGKDRSTTILGTAGGAASESEIETSMKKRHAYRVTVRMDDGSYRTVSLSDPPALAVGDKVRVVEGKLVRA